MNYRNIRKQTFIKEFDFERMDSVITFKSIIISLFMFWITNILLAQEFQDFKLEVLITQLPYANKDITTKFENGKMYYSNSVDNTKLFEKGFDIAFPFFKKSAIVKQNNKYGIIDTKGAFLIEPKYEDFELAPYEHECFIIIFDDDVFDLNAASSNASYTVCEEPASAELYSFIGKNNKLGVKKDDKVIIKPIYDTIYAVESKFVIASMNKKIGVINLEGGQLVDFEYNEIQYSRDVLFDYTHPIFGLNKNDIWTYFNNGKELVKSKYKCVSFSTLLDDSIGIFKFNNKENILFRNGKTLDKHYDFIAMNGLIGTIGNKIFKLNNDGSDELYFQEN